MGHCDGIFFAASLVIFQCSNWKGGGGGGSDN